MPLKQPAPKNGRIMVPAKFALVVLDMQHIHLHEELLRAYRNVERVIRVAKEIRQPVILTRDGRTFQDIHPLIAEAAGDDAVVFPKSGNDAFASGELHSIISGQFKTKTIFLVGDHALHCIPATAEAADRLGYQVYSSTDGNTLDGTDFYPDFELHGLLMSYHLPRMTRLSIEGLIAKARELVPITN